MKPFKLKEYLKDRNKEVVTREGKPVKILCVNLISDKPIVAEIIGQGYLSWRPFGFKRNSRKLWKKTV